MTPHFPPELVGDSNEPTGPALEAAPHISAELSRFCTFMAARNFAPSTIDTRHRTISGFLAWAGASGVREARQVDRLLLERYQLHLFEHRKSNGEPLTFRTQLVRLVAIRSFFKWLAREGVLAQNPAAELELPRGERRLPSTILSTSEIDAVLAIPDVSKPLGLRDRAILETFYATGIRRTELTRLRLFDIDYARQLIVVRKGKGGRDRLVPTGKRALWWIAAYFNRSRPRLSNGREHPELFLNARGRPLRPTKLTERISACVSAAHIGKRGSCHLFRHAAATHMLENGADIRFIQAMLGHESLHTTQIYTHVSIAKLAAVHAATHPRASLPVCSDTV
ncbi:MAG: site-specific tyrosine recombinase XerC [Hyphomonadaceae bacterium]|nr:site-specific tyrosine recombinase XerC [Hyphomonadaceae bacterium]